MLCLYMYSCDRIAHDQEAHMVSTHNVDKDGDLSNRMKHGSRNELQVEAVVCYSCDIFTKLVCHRRMCMYVQR